MISPTTPVHTILQRRKERIAWDDTVLAYLGAGFNGTTFNARVLTSTRAPQDIGKASNEYARDEWDATGEIDTGEAAAAFHVRQADEELADEIRRVARQDLETVIVDTTADDPQQELLL